MVNVTFLHNSKLFTGKSGNDHVEDAKKRQLILATLRPRAGRMLWRHWPPP